jgi:hypothetical protein
MANKIKSNIEDITTSMKEATEAYKQLIDNLNKQITSNPDEKMMSAEQKMNINFTETSKKLLWITLGFFCFAIVAIGIVQVAFKTDLSGLLSYIAPLVTTTSAGYLIKSGYENGQKINK